MLGNRVTRLITTVLTLIGVVLIISLFFNEVLSGSSSALLSLLACYAIGLVYQICADFLNFGFLDNMVGKIIKWIIFFATVAFALLMCLFMHYFDTMDNNNYPIREQGIFAQGLMLSCFFAPVVTTLFCVIQDQILCEEERAPFIPVASFVGSSILGLLTAITGLYTILPLILLVAGIVAIVIVIRKQGMLFEKRLGSSYSGGSSGGYSGYRGGNTGGSLSNYNNNDDDEQPDPRKKDGLILNQMSMRMHSVASSHSGYKSLSRGAYLTLNVRASSSSTSVTFYVDSVLEIDQSYVQDQTDVNIIKNEASSLLRDICYKIRNDAEDEISYLRSEFSDYDRSISIRVNPSSTRVQVR